jgi:hypothetical protein
MTHYENLGASVFYRLLVELEGVAVEPEGARLLVVVEAEPYMAKVTDFCVVLAPAKVDDVSYSEGLELFHVGLCLYCASEREPFAHEKNLHQLAPVRFPN